MRHKQLLHLRSVLPTEISDFPKPDKTNFRMWVLCVKIWFADNSSHSSTCIGNKVYLPFYFSFSPPQGMTSYFYFNKSRKKLKYISQYFVHKPLGHCDMYLSTLKHLFISQPLWIHQIILLGWLNMIHTLEDRQIFGVCVTLSPLPPTQPQQGFISGSKADKDKAENSRQSLNTKEAASTHVQENFCTLNTLSTLTMSQEPNSSASTWHPSGLGLLRNYKFPENDFMTVSELFCNPHDHDNERRFCAIQRCCAWTAQSSVTQLLP